MVLACKSQKFPGNVEKLSWFCCSVAISCLTLCNPVDYSVPGFPVLHHLLEFAQTPILWFGDAIQPSHPLLPPSPPALIFPQHQSFPMRFLFGIRWPKYWSFSFHISPSNEYSGLISFRTDWFDLLVVQGTLESSPIPQFESINSSALNILYDSTLISVPDYWKNHTLDLQIFLSNAV